MQLLAHFVGFKIKKKEKRGLFFAQFKEKKVCHDPVTHSEACVKSCRIDHPHPPAISCFRVAHEWLIDRLACIWTGPSGGRHKWHVFNKQSERTDCVVVILYQTRSIKGAVNSCGPEWKLNAVSRFSNETEQNNV